MGVRRRVVVDLRRVTRRVPPLEVDSSPFTGVPVVPSEPVLSEPPVSLSELPVSRASLLSRGARVERDRLTELAELAGPSTLRLRSDHRPVK